MKLAKLAAPANLSLAWRRITTGGNYQYKRLFRDLYVAYELALADNLADLRSRIVGGAFKARPPERIYLPKSSGLHRPIGLLHIEDQIVIQAFANLAARRLFGKRKQLQFKVVFSNVLEKEDSIFFFKRWQETYAAFQRRIRKYYESGLRWVADFDLAAFYDTVSHDLLIKTIYPAVSGQDDSDWFRDCLATWSSEHDGSRHGHGIPQGPIASDFLAECFLLPIDLSLRGTAGYLRYVDDVRFFGRTEDDVRALVVQLERRCRERGLIPQSGKFTIKQAASIQDAMGMLPSIADPHRSSEPSPPPLLSTDRARRLMMSSIGGKPYRVQDKTRLRYVLYRAEPDALVLKHVVRLVPHHPEHADAFFAYLATFPARASALRLCLDLTERSPYPYVRGEAWVLLARWLETSKRIDAATRRALAKRAIAVAKTRRPENFTETLGACTFLCASEKVGKARHSRFLRFQPPLLQAMAASALPDSAFGRGEVVDAFLRSQAFEPGMSVCGRLHAMGLGPSAFGVSASSLVSQVKNTMAMLGLLTAPSAPIDPVAEILHARYGLGIGKSWHRLLGAEYVHALGLLRQAEAAFNAGISNWLAHQNSFHHAVFIALQRQLASISHAATVKVVGRDGKLVDFGVMLDATAAFSRNCPALGACLREMNARRNRLPSSHPYDKKTQKRARHLSGAERDRFVRDLRTNYPSFVALMP